MSEPGARQECAELLKTALQVLKAATTSRKLKTLHEEIGKALTSVPEHLANVDKYLTLFQKASASAGSVKAVIAALDGVHRFLAEERISSSEHDPNADVPVIARPDGGVAVMDTYIEIVCNCQEQTDENVQVHMIRGILSAVTSRLYGKNVQEKSLMLAVKTCFQLHRDSKSEANQTSAQNALAQMLNVVTQRMELSSTDMITRESMAIPMPAASHPKSRSISLGIKAPKQHLEDFIKGYVTKMIDDVVENLGEEEPERGKYGYCIVCHQPAAHYCVETTLPVCYYECKQFNLDRLALINNHFRGPRGEEGESPAHKTDGRKMTEDSGHSSREHTPVGSDTEKEDIVVIEEQPDEEQVVPDSMNWLHKDALMVFSSLCKYSVKDIPTSGPVDQKHIRSKRLSLELLHSMLVNSGPVFRSSERFMNLVKTLLVLSLVKNCVSPIPKIFSQSLTIFEVLITSFKEHLKGEIGVFIENVFLQILGSGNSTFQHKHRVLKVFYKLCTDVSSALEIFLHFDCNVKERNIFESTVDCLAKIAQGRYLQTEHSNLIQPQQEVELKKLALDALITLVGSLVDSVRESKNESMKEKEKGDAADTTPLQRRTRPNLDGSPESDEEDDFDESKKVDGVAFASFVEQKQRKALLLKGIHKFNMKPKDGLKFFYANKFIEEDSPEDHARFFVETDRLSKTEIGDFLGGNSPLNKAVLDALVSRDSFADLELDVGLRKFLANFRLPGEAQKIDRMMEKFAEKYHADNPGIGFANADTTYVLSFSIIMLNTDAHSDQIKQENKMTKQQFISMNRGINDGQDLPSEYLEKLYQNIVTKPISLGEDDMNRIRLASEAAFGPAQKFDLFLKETALIVQRTQELMRRQRGRQENVYTQAEVVQFVGPLFEVICWPLLATLSVTLETQENEDMIALCIKGFKYCSRLAGIFNMHTERDAFVSSLAKFTYLTQIKEMRARNIDCIKALMYIGLNDGNTLGTAWYYILQCVTQLERLHSRTPAEWEQHHGHGAGGSHAGYGKHSADTITDYRRVGIGVVGVQAITQVERQVETSNAENVATYIDPAQTDLLFAKTRSLDSKGIVAFVTELTRISTEELSSETEPRHFSLQKLVEVADINMGRMRIVWSHIWRILGQHFVEVACHADPHVSMYAIDSLRQLAMKFLEKDELSNYHFQVEFLRPFEVVISTPNVSLETKELVVQIIGNMTQARFANIKSGWKAIFEILRIVSQDVGDKELVARSFQIIEKVMNDHFNLFAENFHEGTRALVAFGMCQLSVQVSLGAVHGLKTCANYLGQNDNYKELPPPKLRELLPGDPSPTLGLASPKNVTTTQQTNGTESSSCIGQALASTGAPGAASPGTRNQVAHWFPILRGLASLVSDQRQEIRTIALETLFGCLKKYGAAKFDRDTWQMVFRGVLFPLFDDIHHQLENAPKSADGRSLWPPIVLSALDNLVELFHQHHCELEFHMPDVLRLLKSCVIHTQESVARVGVEGMKKLLMKCGGKSPTTLSEDGWFKLAQAVEELVVESLPRPLLDVKESSTSLPFDPQLIVTQCVVELLLIDVLREVIDAHLENIPTSAVMKILDSLQASFEFAQSFNGMIAWREQLKRLGFMREMPQIPGLLKQERQGVSCFLTILFRIQKFRDTPDTEMNKRLVEVCRVVLHNYTRKERQMNNLDPNDTSPIAAELEREISGQTTIVCEVVLRGFLDYDDYLFSLATPTLFPLITDLCLCQSREVRVLVRDVLLSKVAPLVRLPQGIEPTQETVQHPTSPTYV